MTTKTKPKVKTIPVAAANVTKVAKATKAVNTAKGLPKLKAPPKSKTLPKSAPGIAAEERRNYVEVAAFFIAERRGFEPGDLMADWLAAERQVDGLIAEGKLGA